MGEGSILAAPHVPLAVSAIEVLRVARISPSDQVGARVRGVEVSP